MKARLTSEAACKAILNAAWNLVAAHGRLDVAQGELAAKADVSRQTVYLAFGGHVGLLVAMLLNKDASSPQVTRLVALGAAKSAELSDFIAYVEAWLDYLPLIYPVSIQLDVAALRNAKARAAWDDRISMLSSPA